MDAGRRAPECQCRHCNEGAEQGAQKICPRLDTPEPENEPYLEKGSLQM